MNTNVHKQNDNENNGNNADDGDNDGGSSVWWSIVTKVEKQVVTMSS